MVFLSTLEAFSGLLYAGMCAAILFGKVNRVQSHAHLTFANAVCLQYEDVDSGQYVDDDSSDSDFEVDTIEEEDDERQRSPSANRVCTPPISSFAGYIFLLQPFLTLF